MTRNVRTVVKILNKSLQVVAEVKSLYPLNKQGTILRYSDELSDWGYCTFRVSTKDPLLATYGDILNPMEYSVWVCRGTAVVWKGIIVDNPERNRNYIEVKAAQYEFLLDKVLIHRDADKPDTDDDESNFKIFKTGTMAANVTTLINDAKTDWGTVHPLATLTIGTVENPDYPKGTKGENGVELTGGWTFTDFISAQFDYHSVYYVLKSFGIYAACDFEITEDLEFNWKKFLGNKNTGVVFEYGQQGNIIDYNFPRLGSRMENYTWGICADDQGKIFHVAQQDSASIQEYGLLQGSSSFSDVKSENLLRTRVREHQEFTKTPEVTPVSVVLDEKSYPLGQFGIGDIVTVKVKDHIIDFNEARRIVGITVSVHDTGRELITVQTNRPKDTDLAS